jgi:RimJ/RimL family protein N-acetyltransferase
MSEHIGFVEIREVDPDDLEIFFRQQQDPESNDIAKVFPRSRSYFDAHWEQSLSNPSVIVRAILFDGVVAGRVTSFTVEGKTLVGYWIDRAHWGKGIATRALGEFVGIVDIRPLYAQVATSNLGSIRVLERCGFEKIGERESPEDERYAACTEAEYQLI